MVEGVRGVGKSSFVRKLLEHTSFVYYKTWGPQQKKDRFGLIKKGLDLPQGTYFVLDFLAQVKTTKPVLADRAALTTLAYQRERFIEARDLHQYYVDLMKRSKAVILLLEASEEEVLKRRLGREDEDEHCLHKRPIESARAIVREDFLLYDDAMAALTRAGLVEALVVETNGLECSCYTPA